LHCFVSNSKLTSIFFFLDKTEHVNKYVIFGHFSNVFSKYQYHFVVSFPSFCGSLFACLLPQQIMRAESVGLLNFYLEYLIRSSSNGFVQKLRKSLMSGSLIFASLNVIIMYGMLKSRCPNFWFSKFKYSNFSSDETGKSVCDNIHSNMTCLNYFNKVSLFYGYEFNF